MNPKDSHRDAAVPARVAEDVIAAGAYISARGWTPATAGNLSARIDAGSMGITASGVDKGALLATDVLVYGFAGGPVVGARPSSAETALHVERYTADANVGAVVHIHARNATVLSMATRGDVIRLEGYELLKALDGVRTHETSVDLPVFPNTQDMDALAREVRMRLGRGSTGDGARTFGYLLAGHGLYAWGRTMADALRHTEALEFLLGCELERRRVA